MTSDSSAGRLFVGIPFPPELRDALQAHLRATFGERMPGRAVVPANWHLTLRFLGDTDAPRLGALEEALRQMDPGPPFELSLAGLGAFPRPARATVLWIGVGDGNAELRALAAKVEAAAVRAGFAPEPKPYSPHLTLSRLNPPADLRRAIDAAPPFGGRMTVDGFVLFRSHLGGGPPRYERVRRYPLTPTLDPGTDHDA
jgi:2'-5' RNA ligase